MIEDQYEVGNLKDAERFSIIRMAKEAGFDIDEGLFPFEASEDKFIGTERTLEAFAALVAAHSFNDGWIKGNKGLMEAVREEREACAKVCEDRGFDPYIEEQCAAAIRARSEK